MYRNNGKEVGKRYDGDRFFDYHTAQTLGERLTNKLQVSINQGEEERLLDVIADIMQRDRKR